MTDQKTQELPFPVSFSGRLNEVVGNEAVLRFSKRAGVSEAVMRNYLAGVSQPGIANLIAIAAAGGVTIEWLATGLGERVKRAESLGFKVPQGLGSARTQGLGYQSPSISDEQTSVLALEMLRAFDGVSVAVIREVLRQAENFLGAVTVLDCSESTEFARAVEGWSRAAEQSL